MLAFLARRLQLGLVAGRICLSQGHLNGAGVIHVG